MEIAKIVVEDYYQKGKIFSSELNYSFFDGRLSKYIELKKYFTKFNIDLVTQDQTNDKDCKFSIYLDTYLLPNSSEELNYLIILEPPSVLPTNFIVENHSNFKKIFTWDDSMVDNTKYFKFNFSFYREPLKLCFSDKKKRFVMIAKNKFSFHENELYTKRVEIINWFNLKQPEEFDLYGVGWDQFIFKKYPFTFFNRFPFFGTQINSILGIKYPFFIKGLNSKFDVLSHYIFCFCYENIGEIDGYITEKIIDCFNSGTIPIYLGARNIKDFIPANTFIDVREFTSFNEMMIFVDGLDENSINNYLDNIFAFMSSNKSLVFDAKYNAKLIADEILMDLK